MTTVHVDDRRSAAQSPGPSPLPSSSTRSCARVRPRGGDAGGLPPTLRHLVLSRVDLLPEAARRVVWAPAAGSCGHSRSARSPSSTRCCPRWWTCRKQAAVRVARRRRTRGRGRRLEGQRLPVPHGLLREVIDHELLPGERISLHRRYGLALARLNGPTDPRLAVRLAHHWERNAGAPLGEERSAIDWQVSMLSRGILAPCLDQEPTTGTVSQEMLDEPAVEATT